MQFFEPGQNIGSFASATKGMDTFLFEMSMKWMFTFKNFRNVYWHGKTHSAMTNAKRYKQKDKEKGDSGRDKHTHKQTQRQKKIVTKKSWRWVYFQNENAALFSLTGTWTHLWRTSWRWSALNRWPWVTDYPAVFFRISHWYLSWNQSYKSQLSRAIN